MPTPASRAGAAAAPGALEETHRQRHIQRPRAAETGEMMGLDQHLRALTTRVASMRRA
jgi:hypothetical protein